MEEFILITKDECFFLNGRQGNHKTKLLSIVSVNIRSSKSVHIKLFQTFSEHRIADLSQPFSKKKTRYCYQLGVVCVVVTTKKL